MRVKQYRGQVFGVDLTAKERKAMNMEINRQIAEADKQYRNNIDIMVLYALRVHLGFGKKRLRRFYEAFSAVHEELTAYYEMSEEDNAWLADRELKKIGVDVAAWNEEQRRATR